MLFPLCCWYDGECRKSGGVLSLVELLFAWKHMTMYFACQFIVLSYMGTVRSIPKMVLESLVIAVVCTAATYLLEDVFPVAFVGVLVMILAGIYHHLRHRGKMTNSILMHFDLYTLSLFSNILLGSVAYGIVYAINPAGNWVMTAVLNQTFYIAEMLLICFITGKQKKKKVRPYWFTAFSILCCIIMLCNFVIVMPASITANHAELAFILVAVVSCIGLAVWLWERRRENEEKQKLLIEIKKLRSQVHHYKEFIPAMKRKFDASLEELKRKTTDIKILEKFRPLVEEIDRLYEEQMEESRREFLQASTLAKTGVIFVDALLEQYYERAHKEDISFDVRVFDSPQHLFRRHLIPQLKLEELLGDLLTNAFRAILRKKIRFDEAVEINMGITDDGYYEIDVYDTGEPFPAFILENFGERGLTTGGTGEGIANMLEILQANGITMKISEFDGTVGEFSKCITLRFSGKFEVVLDTKRDIYFHLVCSQESTHTGGGR